MLFVLYRIWHSVVLIKNVYVVFGNPIMNIKANRNSDCVIRNLTYSVS